MKRTKNMILEEKIHGWNEAVNLPMITYVTPKTVMTVFIREEEKIVSVFEVSGKNRKGYGTIGGTCAIIQEIQEDFPGYTISDQVGNESELRAMYAAGLRSVTVKNGVEYPDNLDTSLWNLEHLGSVHMRTL